MPSSPPPSAAATVTDAEVADVAAVLLGHPGADDVRLVCELLAGRPGPAVAPCAPDPGRARTAAAPGPRKSS